MIRRIYNKIPIWKRRFLLNRKKIGTRVIFPQIFRIESRWGRSHLSHAAENHESDWNPHDFPNSDSDDNKNPRREDLRRTEKNNTHTETDRRTDRRALKKIGNANSRATWPDHVDTYMRNVLPC